VVVAEESDDVAVVVCLSGQWRYGRVEAVVCASVVVDASSVFAPVSASVASPRHGRYV
jgi:hypothetical protein